MLRPRVIAKYLLFMAAILLKDSLAWSYTLIPVAAPPPSPGILPLKTAKNFPTEAEQNLKNRESKPSSVSESAVEYSQNKNRAQQMINLLQDEELSKAFKKITEGGNKTLRENPGIRAPLAIISGAAAFWAGKTMNLFQQESFRFSAKIEGRYRRSEFSMESPLLNGKMKFDNQSGVELGVTRRFEPFKTDAMLNYNVRNQSVTTEVRHKLAPNVDLTFGASRFDQNTRIEYRFNF